MGQYEPEIRRALTTVEILEKLDLAYNITEEEYRKTHEVDGEVRAVIEPDSEVRRARKYPPVSLPERIVSAVTGSRSLALETGYPGTSFYVGLVCNPPVMRGDELAQQGMAAQKFSLEDLPTNGTIRMSKNWDTPEVEQKLTDDQGLITSHQYEIEQYPSEHIPVVIRGNLYRDAREQAEKRNAELQRQVREIQSKHLSKEQKKGMEREARRLERQVANGRDLEELKKEMERDARRLEGYAMLTLELEYRGDSPDAESGSTETMHIESFRADLSSTFSDIQIYEQGAEASNYTYNPEEKRVEWHESYTGRGGTVKYNIVGPFSELIDIEHISASFRGQITDDTLTGTRIRGLFTETGEAFYPLPRRNRPPRAQQRHQSEFDVNHTIRLKGEIEIDTEALAGDATTHTTSEIRLEEHPEDAFDRLETVCHREGISVLSSDGFGTAEPVPGREGVFQFTAGEKGDADDRAARMEVKREFGDEGVVYADIQVTGKYTAVSQRSEVSAFDESDERIVRSDEGGLEERGKATIEIRARSTSSALNTEVINKIGRGLSGKGASERGAERGDDERLPPPDETDDRQELPGDAEREPDRLSRNGGDRPTETGNRELEGGDP